MKKCDNCICQYCEERQQKCEDKKYGYCNECCHVHPALWGNPSHYKKTCIKETVKNIYKKTINL